MITIHGAMHDFMWMTPGKRENCLDGRALPWNREGEPLDIVASQVYLRCGPVARQEHLGEVG